MMTIENWLGENNKLGIDIWHKKYQRNNESFEDWVNRVSGGKAAVAQLLIDKKFLFGGRILSNRGVSEDEERTTYSNCYVITPPEDSIESIYDTCKKLARTYSYGGGCGIDISGLAPAGAKVHNQAKTTSGAVSFMDTFSQVTEQIGQNGRRGALMISMRCDHPDIEKFITIKSDLGKVNYANISVMVTDAFMWAVENDKDWTLCFYRPETDELIGKTVKARDLFNLICEQNWNYAEPGVLFWDRISQYSLLGNNPEFKYAGTNPCAEEPLPAGGSCLLGSLNLAAFVEDGRFQWEDFKSAVRIAVVALNDVLNEGVTKHPLQEQRDSVRDWRQIGLGVMGIADMLIKMGLRYGSDKSIQFCDYLGYVLAQTALEASSMLAKECCVYPKYNELVLKSEFFKAHKHDQLLAQVETYGLRNSQLLTIAPTGTISTMIGVSGGIEPIFANSYTRTTKSLHGEDVKYKVYTPIVEEYMKENGLTDELELPEYFVTSADLTVEERIAMQSVWQKHIDASISSTVNLPEESTVEDVKNIYMSAWRNGLKGITVYRSGCARAAILNTSEGKDTTEKKEVVKTQNTAPQERTVNIGLERHLTTGCGTLHVCAYFDPEGNLQNTYLSKGSTGGCNNFMIGLSRMISLSARNGVDIHDIVDQLNSCGSCPSYAVRKATKKDTSPGSCCPVAIGKALIDMWKEINNGNGRDCAVVHRNDGDSVVCGTTGGVKCPECGAPLIFEGGCNSCKNCGFSKCD